MAEEAIQVAFRWPISRGLIAVGLLDAPKAAAPAPKFGAEGVKPVSRKGGSSPRKAK